MSLGPALVVVDAMKASPATCSPQLSAEPEGLHVTANTPPKRRRRLRVVVLNDSAKVLKMLCDWLQSQDHHCDTALLAEMPHVHEEVGRGATALRVDGRAPSGPSPRIPAQDHPAFAGYIRDLNWAQQFGLHTATR